MRIAAAMSLLVLMVPVAAAAQSVEVAAGRTLLGAGSHVSAGVGFSPTSRLDLVASIERIHLPFEEESTPGGGFSVTRGGTMTFGSGELRVSLFPRDRVSPFVLVGGGWGVSRPTTNSRFPDVISNDLGVIFVGGGIRVPVGRHFSVLAEARAALALEASDSAIGLVPIRAGVIWRF